MYDRILNNRPEPHRMGEEAYSDYRTMFRADLVEAYTHAIDELDTALGTAMGARREVEALSGVVERVEAGTVLAGVEGKNETERKARLTLTLADDPHHTEASDKLRDARFRLADAERRVTVLKERCRLFRSVLAPGE